MNAHFFIQTVSVFFASLFFSWVVQAAPAGLTYQGRLVKNNLPVEANPVVLTVKVTSPGVNECVLYEETHTLNMTNSDGIFSVKIGSGTRTVNDEALSMVQVFSNTNSIMNGLVCGGGATSYTSVSADSRNIYATFNDGVDTVAFSSPYVIQSVPYALEAERLEGKTASEFLQTTADTTQSKINALTAVGPYAELLALINGTSTQYLTPSSAISTTSNINQSGTGTFSQSYTGTGTASTITANSVTTSAVQSITGNGLTSGSLLSLSSNSTSAAAGNKGLDVAISGANSTVSVTRTGISSVVNSTGTSSTNVAGYFSASGATNNYGLIVASGNVGIGTTTPSQALDVNGIIQGYGLTMAGGSPSPYVSSSTSVPIPSGNLINAVNNGGGTGADGILAGIRFTPMNGSSINQRAYIGALTTTGASSYTPAIVFGQQTGNVAFNERMRIDTSGNVGIGTTSPGSALDVQGPAGGGFRSGLRVSTSNSYGPTLVGYTDRDANNRIFFSGTFTANDNQPIIFGSASNIYLNYQSAGQQFLLSDGTNGFLTVKDQGTTSDFAVNINHLSVRSTGNVGIGTASPTHSLTLASSGNGLAQYNTTDQNTNYERGVLKWVGNTLLIGSEFGGTGNLRTIRMGAGGLPGQDVSSGRTLDFAGAPPFFKVNASTSLAGNIFDFSSLGLVGTLTNQVALSVNPTITQSGTAGYTALLINPTESSIGSGNNRLLDVQVGGSSRFIINNTGNVGIGTTTPLAPLDVGGYGTPENVVTPTALFSANDNSIAGIEMKNKSTGTSADFRFSVYDTSGNYLAFAQPSVNNSATLLGQTRSTSSYLFTNGTRKFTLGTVTAQPLIFGTNNIERLRIDSTGNVGVGTTAPTHALTLPASSSGVALYNSADQTTNFERVWMGWTSNIFNLLAENGGTGSQRVFRIGTTAKYINIGTYNLGGVFNFDVGSSSTPISGVGISGTQTQTSGSVNIQAILPTINQSGTASYRAFWISPYQLAVGSGTQLLMDVGANSAASGGGTHTSRFAVTASGNVGIGTTTPQSTLQVNGYVQLALTTGAPPAGDCDAAAEHGRMRIDATSGVNRMYFCTADGWRYVSGL